MAIMQGSRNTTINPHTMDKDYDLVSVLYHALQAADTCGQYEQDAKTEGSPEVAEFMREVQEQNTRIAQKAKELLMKQKQV
jgi:methionyl-tRNA formyltransferase